MSSFFREPLVHFILIGALIYGVYGIYGTTEPEESGGNRRIVVDKDRVDSFIAAWKARWQREPTRQELNGLINQYIREIIYYREAVAMGLGKDDPLTRRRMAQKLEFLTQDIATMKEPPESELKNFFQANMEKYQVPDRISFTQIFLNPDKRGEAILDDANVLLAELKGIGAPDETVLGKSDSHMLQAIFQQQSEQQVGSVMGPRFANEVMSLKPGEWHGPLLSTYGTHLVYVHEHKNSPPPVFEVVKDDVLQDWQTQQQERLNKEFYEGLKSRYEIVFDGVPPLSDNTRKSEQAVADNKQSIARSDT